MPSKKYKNVGRPAKKLVSDRESSPIQAGSDTKDPQEMSTSRLESYEDFEERMSDTSKRTAGLTSEPIVRRMIFGVALADICYYVIPFIVGIFGAWLIGQYWGHLDFGLSSVKKPVVVARSGQKPSFKGGEKKWQALTPESYGKLKLFTDSDVAYTKGGKLLLVVVGHVFDVSTAETMYGEGSGYHAFIGHDASRSFVTGKFEKPDLTPDLTGLEVEDFKSVSGWIDFYLGHKEYKFVGLHIGTYFDENGKETLKMAEFRKMVALAEENKKKEEAVEKLFPSCNMEWTAESGSRLWCSKLSGGIDREWVGFPRIFKQEDKPERCACVHPNYLADKRVKQYVGCAPSSVECRLMN